MILEAGIVVSKAADSVMVETIQKTTCDSCAAQPACGHSVLSKLTSSSVQIRVLLGDFDANVIRLCQSVTIGIPDHVVVKGSLLVYLVPLIGALLGAWLMGSPVKSPELDLISVMVCLLFTSPSPRDGLLSRMLSSASTNKHTSSP